MKCKNNFVSPAKHFHCILGFLLNLFIRGGLYTVHVHDGKSWLGTAFLYIRHFIAFSPVSFYQPLRPLFGGKASPNSRHFICNFLFLLAFYDFFFSTSWAAEAGWLPHLYRQRGEFFSGFSQANSLCISPLPSLPEIGNICVMQFSLLAGKRFLL